MEDTKFLQTQLGLTEDRVTVVENEVEGALQFYKNIEEIVYHLYKIQHLGELERFYAVYLAINKNAEARLAATKADYEKGIISYQRQFAELRDQLAAAKQPFVGELSDMPRVKLGQMVDDMIDRIASLEQEYKELKGQFDHMSAQGKITVETQMKTIADLREQLAEAHRAFNHEHSLYEELKKRMS